MEHCGGNKCEQLKKNDCSCEQKKDNEDKKDDTIQRIIIGTVFFVCGLLVSHFSSSLMKNWPQISKFVLLIRIILFMISYLVVGFEVVKKAAWNIFHGEIFDENFLMSIASLGAVAIGQYPEAVAVMLFYLIGEYFEDRAIDKSRNSIKSLMDIRPEKAFLLQDGKVIQSKPEDISIGDRILVKPGERIPLDGIIVKGNSFVNTSALTGESVPREVTEGTEVMAGFVNTQGILEISVTKIYEDSAVSRILNLLETATERKAKTEQFIARFARYYTPIVCACAVILAIVPPLVVSGSQWSVWFYRALIFLVISCPCALVISVPLSFFAGIGVASRHGILIKGSNYLESLTHVKMAVFDKTGTLTRGVFVVTDVHPANPLKVSAEKLIAIATHAEFYSNHPISKSLREAHHGECCERCTVSNTEEISGQGLRVQLDGQIVLAGNTKLMQNFHVGGFVPCDKNDTGTIVHIAIDGLYAGHIVIADEVKPDSAQTIRDLKKLGVEKTVMLTGDTFDVAKKVATDLCLDDFYSDLLPGDKLSRMEELFTQNDKGTILFAGDGINDAPVLARADIGVAMGNLGADVAIESADVIIMRDEPGKIVESIRIAQKTVRIARSNIIFALSVKILVLVLGAVGIANMWMAVFADVGVTFIAILNAMRLLITDKR